MVDLGADGRITVDWLLKEKKNNVRVWTVVIWIRIWTNCDHLCTEVLLGEVKRSVAV